MRCAKSPPHLLSGSCPLGRHDSPDDGPREPCAGDSQQQESSGSQARELQIPVQTCPLRPGRKIPLLINSALTFLRSGSLCPSSPLLRQDFPTDWRPSAGGQAVLPGVPVALASATREVSLLHTQGHVTCRCVIATSDSRRKGRYF